MKYIKNKIKLSAFIDIPYILNNIQGSSREYFFKNIVKLNTAIQTRNIPVLIVQIT